MGLVAFAMWDLSTLFAPGIAFASFFSVSYSLTLYAFHWFKGMYGVTLTFFTHRIFIVFGVWVH